MKPLMTSAAIGSLLLTMLLAQPAYSADEKAEKAKVEKSEKEAKGEKADKSELPEKLPSTIESGRRLPNQFGKLNLSQEQREAAIKVQDKYADKIAVLQQEIRKLREEQDKEIREVLSSDQKEELDKLRAESEKAKADADKTAEENLKRSKEPKRSEKAIEKSKANAEKRKAKKAKEEADEAEQAKKAEAKTEEKK